MKWLSTWKYLPIVYENEMAAPENRTQRVSFRNNLRGEAVRVLLSNKTSRKPLTITRMTVGEAENGQLIRCLPVTSRGKREITLAPGEERFSDDIPLAVQPGREIAVSLYVEQRQSVESICNLWARGNTCVAVNEAGDETEAACLSAVDLKELYPSLAMDTLPEQGLYFFGFSAVQVLTEDSAKLLACFGDSITHMSYVTNEIIKRLYAAMPGQAAVINCGIGGNRLMHDATFIPPAPAQGRIFGTAGVTRFEQDVYGIDTPDAVLILEGINDIMHPIQISGEPETTPACVITAGYELLAGVARRHGSRVFGATVTPCGFDAYPAGWVEKFDATRTEVNARLREKHPYDGLFDYDAAVRDPQRPAYMKEGYSLNDGLHPGYTAAERMAATVELDKLFSE